MKLSSVFIHSVTVPFSRRGSQVMVNCSQKCKLFHVFWVFKIVCMLGVQLTRSRKGDEVWCNYRSEIHVISSEKNWRGFGHGRVTTDPENLWTHGQIWGILCSVSLLTGANTSNTDTATMNHTSSEQSIWKSSTSFHNFCTLVPLLVLLSVTSSVRSLTNLLLR